MDERPTEARAAAACEVTDAGIVVAGDVDAVLDVLVDGRRVWSFAPSRDTVVDKERRLARWPDALRPFLSGRARVSVREHLSGRVHLERDVRLGHASAPMSVRDADGRPLAVDKSGRLQPTFAERDRSSVATLVGTVDDVLRLLAEDGGVPAFLSFGCLLGAVRSGHLIGHDSDADVSYLSAHTHPVDLALESYHLERLAQRLGWTTRRMSGGDFKVMAPLPDGGQCGIDVFTAFYADGLLHMMPTVRSPVPRRALLPLGTVELAGRRLPAPAAPEALLAATYGEGWRVPDPAFLFSPPSATRRRLTGWFRGERRHRRFWDEFYTGEASAGVPVHPSPFALWVRQREHPPGLVVDVGSGTGRDALWFAGQGFDVVGVDYSGPAVAEAAEQAVRRGLRASFQTLNLYDLRQVLTCGALLARHPEGRRALYARFLVHALEDEGRHNLWLLAGMALSRGGRLYLEFRTEQDGTTRHTFGEHFRRLLSADRVVQELESAGAEVEDRLQGRGMARYRDEDPHVCRLVARWTG
ncbi:MAG: class I SAM-dependent methyltransferase [Actinomycetota bacterium]|nr:class I SAM-dependent methyltransferase [Actinomycetota bacterium]